MKKSILICALSLSISTAFAANTLTSTDLKGTSEPNKAEIYKAIKALSGALKTKSDKSYSKLVDKARKLITKKSGVKTYNAAIVMMKDGKSENLADYEDFLEAADGVCYNGNIKTALMIAETLQNDIWIYDEYSLDSIEIKGDVIEFKVIDEFSFGDQDASEDDRDEFITTYTASKC